jgi:hypothetical protein
LKEYIIRSEKHDPSRPLQVKEHVINPETCKVCAVLEGGMLRTSDEGLVKTLVSLGYSKEEVEPDEFNIEDVDSDSSVTANKGKGKR